MVTDELDLVYQVGAWGPPASLVLIAAPLGDGRVSVRAELRDASGLLCLDDAGQIRWSLAGDGELIDNQGTPWGSRLVQLANGRAEIRLWPRGGTSQVAASYRGLATAFCMVGSRVQDGRK